MAQIDQPKNCGNCKWWEPTWRDDPWGECHYCPMSGWNNKYVSVGDYDYLLTSADFGCIFYLPKELTNDDT